MAAATDDMPTNDVCTWSSRSRLHREKHATGDARQAHQGTASPRITNRNQRLNRYNDTTRPAELPSTRCNYRLAAVSGQGTAGPKLPLVERRSCSCRLRDITRRWSVALENGMGRCCRVHTARAFNSGHAGKVYWPLEARNPTMAHSRDGSAFIRGSTPVRAVGGHENLAARWCIRSLAKWFLS